MSNYPGNMAGGGRNRRIGFMMSQLDVLTALGQEQMRSNNGRVDPGFAQQVFESYIQCKLQKGRTRYEIVPKLEELERGLPHMARSFQLARKTTGLPPSRLFAPLTETPPTSATSLGIRRATTNPTPTRLTQGAGVPAAAARSGITNRPVSQPPSGAAEGEDAPPPPYQRTDPEPEATRMLEATLAQQADAAGTVETAGEVMTAGERQEWAQAMQESAAEAARGQGQEEVGLVGGEGLSRRVTSPPTGGTSGYGQVAPQQQQQSSLGRQDTFSLVPHRRSLSHAGRGLPNELNQQMNALHIPGAFPEEPPSQPTPHPVPETIQTPIEPVAQPLKSHGTGSKNPFFSAATPSDPASAQSPTASGSRNPFADPSSTGEAPGSSHTVFLPPPGPPPGHITTPTPEPTLPTRARPVSQPPLSPSSTRSIPAPPNSAPILARAPTLPGRRGSLTHNHPSGEDPLTLLRSYDTVILLDDSGSMAGGRWRQAKVALMDLAEQAARYDDDGLELWFINNERKGEGLVTSVQVEALFSEVKPGGSTPTGMALERILLPYIRQIERYKAAQESGDRGVQKVKPMNLIVITDGAPTDDPESVLAGIARRLDRGDFPLSQLGVQFIQIGNDQEAQEALQELDDNLSEKHGVRDMVDTVVYEEGRAMDAEFLVKCLLGGINRRMDRRDA